MGQMRQWWIVPGPDGGVAELRTVDIPLPAAGQVLVRVIGAGLNRGELMARAALRSQHLSSRPFPSGIEFAGLIEAVGGEVTGWPVGTRVMGRGRSCHADYTLADAGELMATPSQLSDVEAAAIPNVFVTANDALVTAAGTGAADRVLITAGASGVGTAAIQIARHLGARRVMATTRSPAKTAALLTLGATEVIDTSAEGWPELVLERVDGVDVVIDQVGGRLFPGLLRTMAVQGRYVSVGRNDGNAAPLDLDLLARQRLTLIGVTFRTRSPAEAQACSARFAAHLLAEFRPGGLRPTVDRTFPLDALPAAQEYMAADTQVGKILLTP